jgi:sterol desaturase/sphingolipid hydroxylase (fatty acid hydroxylase superfamily)
LENLIRLAIACSIFGIMVCWEIAKPKRIQSVNRKQRWPVNLGLALLNMVLMRLTIGGLAYISQGMAMEQGYGVLNIVQLPNYVSIIATLVILDFAIYAQHILMHKWPLLWRLHKVHHTDLGFDATTAVRFHPIEIVISMLYKAMCVVLIGGNPDAIIAFEIILNGAATFNHSNVRIPEKIDKIVRRLIITPDMHRIHHSADPAETDSNYGFSVSCWDRLCKTYTAEPKQPQTTMPIGLNAYRKQDELDFIQCMLIPFKAPAKRQG